MGNGETGTHGTRRKHWHINLYLSKPSGWVSSDRDGKGKLVREERDWWPHGFVTVDVMGDFSTDRRVAAARYVQKYAEKMRGEQRRGATKAARTVTFFQSQGKAYGAEWIEKEARRTAAAGLPYHGTYMVPGLNFGPRVKSARAFVRWLTARAAGGAASRGDPFKPMKNMVQGACRKYAIAAYRAEWEARYPGRDIPATDFMRLNDEEFIEPRRLPPAGRQSHFAGRAGARPAARVQGSPVLLPEPRICRRCWTRRGAGCCSF